MAKKKGVFAKEAELQELLVNAIDEQRLDGLIEDVAELRKNLAAPQENLLPQFAIDHLARKAALRAGYDVLETLDLLERISADEDVSMQAGETLRPDIVCINAEQESIVLFELKKEKQTGRQALTELLAYEQEIRNHLPLLSNYDFNFVLVSAEWSPLMDHAVSAAVAWGRKKILCLEAGLAAGELTLQTRVPEAWRITGSVYLPEEALPCVTVSLSLQGLEAQETATEGETAQDASAAACNGNEEVEARLDLRLLTALELIVREGERAGAHGFAVLWRDHSASVARHNITVCGIDAFALYQRARVAGMIEKDLGPLTKGLDAFVRDRGPYGHSEALLSVAESANGLLEEFCNPELDGLHDWRTERTQMMTSAAPMYCGFWGALGDFAREFVAHPGIRKHRRNLLHGGQMDWRDPPVGLVLIESFLEPELFFEGEVRCRDAFGFGRLWGLHRLLRLMLREAGPDQQRVKCRYDWNRWLFAAAMDEVQLLASSSDTVRMPERPLQFRQDPFAEDEEEFKRACDWFCSEMLQGSPMHVALFELGLNGAFAFNDPVRDLMSDETKSGYRARVEGEVRDSASAILGMSHADERQMGGEDVDGFRAFLLRQLGLKGTREVDLSVVDRDKLFDAWPRILELADKIAPSVFHLHAPVMPVDVDWIWLKQGVREQREKGVLGVGVVLSPDGKLGTANLFEGLPVELITAFQITDQTLEVLFMDRSSTAAIVEKVLWADLESGAVFERLRDRFRSLSEEE